MRIVYCNIKGEEEKMGRIQGGYNRYYTIFGEKMCKTQTVRIWKATNKGLKMRGIREMSFDEFLRTCRYPIE